MKRREKNSSESAVLNSLFSAAWCSNNTQHDTFSGRGSLFTLSSTSPDNLHDSSRDIYWPFRLLPVALRPASSLSSCCVWQFDHFDALFDSVNGSVSSSTPISAVAGWGVWETTTTANWCRWMGFGKNTADDDDEWILRTMTTSANNWVVGGRVEGSGRVYYCRNLEVNRVPGDFRPSAHSAALN